MNPDVKKIMELSEEQLDFVDQRLLSDKDDH